MNSFLRSSAFLVATLVASTPSHAAAPEKAAKPVSPILKQIDALLKHRLRPEPLPIDPPNPFVVTGGGIRDGLIEGSRVRAGATLEPVSNSTASANPDREATPPTNADVLAACAGRLKIGGMIRIKDQVQVIINDAPRKEGDFLTMQWSNMPVHLRIVRLQPDQIVLRYMDAELTLRY